MPVTQALGLLKDQTRPCLFIPLILFSTWLYYLPGLLQETAHESCLTQPPPKAATSTRTLVPKIPWGQYSWGVLTVRVGEAGTT